MPPLFPLAVRYVLWLIGLRIVYVAAIGGLGVPNLPSITVILMALPALDVAVQARRRATRDLVPRDWALLWCMMFTLFLSLMVALPVGLMVAGSAADTQLSVEGLSMLSLGTALMLAVFTWIGARIGLSS
ncbi:hypothetical protein V8J82_18120 [Gymnodinialimonas sp. 2305UL16-5]|uniref:hypothetical protein n=1 Tax=Gymnodinialimonas mytili TaxID=3126503 RepID=UPI00309DE933